MSATFSLLSPFELMWLRTLYAPLESEVEFVTKLNLSFPVTLPHDKKVDLRRVNVEDGSWVEISVTCLPARLYEFTVYSVTANAIFRIRTGGTGDIRNYWKIVEAALLDKLHMIKPEQWIKNLHYYQIEVMTSNEPTSDQ